MTVYIVVFVGGESSQVGEAETARRSPIDVITRDV